MIRKFLARTLITALLALAVFPCAASAQSFPYTSNPCAPSNTTLLVPTPINITTSGTFSIITTPPTTTQRVYICKVVIIAAGATNVTLEGASNTGCSQNLSTLTGPMPLAASAGWVEAPGAFPAYFTAAGSGLCIINSAAIQVSGSLITVTQ